MEQPDCQYFMKLKRTLFKTYFSIFVFHIDMKSGNLLLKINSGQFS